MIMKRTIVAGLSILAVVAGVGWKLASHPETSTGLQEVSLAQGSEHSHPGPTAALARVRVRLSPSDFAYEAKAATAKVPRITLAAK
jgi:hypothetical protein